MSDANLAGKFDDAVPESTQIDLDLDFQSTPDSLSITFGSKIIKGMAAYLKLCVRVHFFVALANIRG